MLKFEANQFNFYSQLYNKIPKNHILKQINSAISLNFVNELLKDSYCSHFGRPAKEPEMMMRILILQYLYNLSDERVMEELQVNLAYEWFIGVNPDSELPHPSLLSKFRTTRLQDVSLDEVITEIVRQCIEKGIIKDTTGISVDATHIEANTIKKVPERIMKHLARKIFKATNEENYEIPDYEKIEDPKEAKKVMKEYLEEVIESVENKDIPEVKEAEEILNSNLFIEQKGIRSLIDKDARVGHKSQTQNFFGYKMEYCQTTENELITAVQVKNGAYMDGSEFENIYNKTKESGLKINECLGDKAYFKVGIIEKLEEENVKPYIPVSACSYRVDEELYSYNKDSDQWFCIYGNETVRKKDTSNKNRKSLTYYFEKNKCKDCPYREKCIGTQKSIAKKLNIGVNAPKYYEYSQFNKTEEYLNEYKKRARIEGKNAEMKRFHGLARARGYGLKSVEIQAKLTAIAVNLKKIGKLFSLNIPYNLDKFLILIKYSKKLLKIVFKSFLLPLFQWFRTSIICSSPCSVL